MSSCPIPASQSRARPSPLTFQAVRFRRLPVPPARLPPQWQRPEPAHGLPGPTHPGPSVFCRVPLDGGGADGARRNVPLQKVRRIRRLQLRRALLLRHFQVLPVHPSLANGTPAGFRLRRPQNMRVAVAPAGLQPLPGFSYAVSIDLASICACQACNIPGQSTAIAGSAALPSGNRRAQQKRTQDRADAQRISPFRHNLQRWKCVSAATACFPAHAAPLRQPC